VSNPGGPKDDGKRGNEKGDEKSGDGDKGKKKAGH